MPNLNNTILRRFFDKQKTPLGHRNRGGDEFRYLISILLKRIILIYIPKLNGYQT